MEHFRLGQTPRPSWQILPQDDQGIRANTAPLEDVDSFLQLSALLSTAYSVQDPKAAIGGHPIPCRFRRAVDWSYF